MLKEATLVTNSGIPLWVRSGGATLVTNALTGAMLGALSMFSSEITGKLLRSVEMSDGFVLHIRPFRDGVINLAVVGDENIFGDPELLKIIDKLEDDIDLMIDGNALDVNDSHTVSIFLEPTIKQLDNWFGSKVFVQTAIQKARKEQIIEISSQIAMMESRLSQEKIALMILDASLETLYTSPNDQVSESFLSSLQSHLKGWIKVSSHAAQLLPSILYFDDICIGLKSVRHGYVICALSWTTSVGDPKIVNKVRSWLSLLGRRLR